MPELPDVEVFKRYLNSTALHKLVNTVRVYDDSIVKDVSPSTLRRRVKGHRFESGQRHGKHLFADLGKREGWLGFHFGMTGYLKYFKTGDGTPEHTRVRFDFENGYHLAFVCVRKLGALRIVNDLDQFIEDHDLGPDALEVDLETFRERLQERRGGIKGALMDQSILAGIGNIYADEVLFHARLHPETRVSNLSDKRLRMLHTEMKRVLKTAIEAKADPSEMPSNFLLHHRHMGETCPRCGGRIHKVTMNGRPTYLCPKCQKKRG